MQQTQNVPAGAVVAHDLSPEQLAEIEKRRELRAERLDALGESLAKSRGKAIQARQQLGIDQQFREDLEFYEGIDDANRDQVKGAWSTKPPGQIAPQAQGEVRSTVFVNITNPYCDAAAARIGDMLMPTDDRAFSIDPTPKPELEVMAKGKFSTSVRKSMMQQAANADAYAQSLQGAQEEAKRQMEEAKEKSEKAQTRIDDWLVEGQYHAEVRKVIDDTARLGTGVLKGPVPVKRNSHKVLTDGGAMTLVEYSKIAPTSNRVDPLNLFPDSACGENIQNGSFVWERDFLSRRKVQDLLDDENYLTDQLHKVLDEGPKKATGDAELPQGMTETDIDGQFEVWYYTGLVEQEDMEAAGCDCSEMPEHKSVFALITMINARVVKAVEQPLDTGGFPYDVFVWQRQAGRWTGIGVARQIRTPQRIVNAATRNMLDNAGLSAGPQILVKLGVVQPADGNANITPRKLWYIREDAELSDVKQAFGVFNVESRQQELMSIIEFGLKIAENVTGLPLLLQGQQGQAPDTLGGQQMFQNNANTVLRRLAKNYDDGITEPHIRRYYVWLMQHGEDDSEKGDFQVDARGSSALVERDIQNQAIGQMGNIVSNPAFGVNPRKWFAEWCKSQRLDAKAFQYTDEEQKQIDEMAAQGPQDPRLAVAQLRAQVDERIETIRQNAKLQITQLEQQFEGDQRARDRQLEAVLANLQTAADKGMSADELKTMLAKTVMTLRTQKELAMTRATAPQVARPVAEPPGRAPAGQAFQR